MLTFSSIYYVSDLMVGGRLKRPSRTMRGEFPSLEDKYRKLMEMCERNVRVTGGPAYELFNVGGDLPLMWLDIDCRDSRLIEDWMKSSSFPFPLAACLLVPSTTGRYHMYVRTDRPLEIDECISMHELIIRSTNGEEKLVREIDRVYGPDHYMNVFIPFASTGSPVLPQVLMKNIKSAYTMPCLERIKYDEWSVRKKALRESILGPDPE